MSDKPKTPSEQVLAEAAPFDLHADEWWCWECHGLGGWYEDYDDCTGEDVECGCCGGGGYHGGDDVPRCHPAARCDQGGAK